VGPRGADLGFAHFSPILIVPPRTERTVSPVLADAGPMPAKQEDALAAEKPSFNRGPDGRTSFRVPSFRNEM
jgi:hypothetical protein